MKSPITRFAFLLTLLLLPLLPHRAAAQAGKYTYMHMTTIESVVAGGLGRSRVLFTPDFKGQKEVELENLFSLTGINMKNVRFNEEAILRFLGDLNAEGWELVQATPLTQTLESAGTTGQGIFMTRYLFRKAR
ncbi:hypothetical protein E5K00_16390 [Hymenobacter aquaticus]|uniref:DUF4177 domain-containing protein n=1 Tax=Hymenobacter aquaticus TaxID=1867101 RepID=A0A4Z0PWJ5_9BACT|nr:hypothetical protein [Hymenobacter aquaticus]TGE21845.1 hypothetical protein E5K00_16390 [Hymenobacter aquaticus]